MEKQELSRVENSLVRHRLAKDIRRVEQEISDLLERKKRLIIAGVHATCDKYSVQIDDYKSGTRDQWRITYTFDCPAETFAGTGRSLTRVVFVDKDDDVNEILETIKAEIVEQGLEHI